MQGYTESDYLLFVEGKAIAVIEAKKEENNTPTKRILFLVDRNNLARQTENRIQPF